MLHTRTSKTSFARATGGLLVAAAVVALALTGPAAANAHNGNGHGGHPPKDKTVDVQLLSFNDFHGNLMPPSGSSGRLTDSGGAIVDVGGVEYLATHLAQAREGHRNSLTVAAGDLIGASPLLSGAFHDEPSIEALNALHLDVSAVGNHEFDEGYRELQRMADGGCLADGDGENNQNSCPAGKFRGADFDFLAANVVKEGTNKTILPAYSIERLSGGVKIGFIGMTLEETPDIVTAAGIEGLEFRDEVATANALVPVLRKQGVNAIVVLVHQGGTPNVANAPYDAACGNGAELDPGSPIIPIAQGLSPAIDLIVSGHTHQPYVCNIPDPAGNARLVTSASSFGRLYTDTTLTYDKRTDDVVRTSVSSANMLVTRDVTADPAEAAIIAKYQALVAPLANRVIGQISASVTRTANPAGETPLGDLIADAQLADPSVVGPYGTPQLALMNPGGIRADLLYDAPPAAPGSVTFGAAFTVQPFNNYLVSLDLTGAQIKQLLNQQWSGANAASKKILQVSEGFAYSYSGTTLGAVTLNGVPLDDAAVYRVVTNNFLAGGGDGFGVFTQAQNVYFGGLDIDAFAAYLTANSPYAPTVPSRITLTP
ncbi:bifunctional metallophosphatase/5'-nucleotidase [Agromyces seonyuensis]|uniref:Bifunctional metallophosphatase/5'-nucleotidase n=1 Tax=Agromyces seonyuensis TaxID=2662446 RepID=A0A6I4NXA0_9MICO|nr:bifunctional metallophosphatase/5'-nucleotidase [Agromyces seonyuensis]MWB97742.1 bifunctional metallophosphatase/5'-nucleotidase [Agromyces seonyuensis]